MSEPFKWSLISDVQLRAVHALMDKVQQLTLELEVCRHDETDVQYWAGQDDGCRGAALRWQQALTEPIPKAGVMGSLLEPLYRQTEALRLDLVTAEGSLHLIRGQRDGYAYLLSGVLAAIEDHWEPHDEASRTGRLNILKRLSGIHDAAWEAIKANAVTPMTYAIEQRLRFIDFLLEHYGHVGRPQLVAFFGISIPCASADIARYNQDSPGNAVYDFSAKRWVRTEAFKPHFS